MFQKVGEVSEPEEQSGANPGTKKYRQLQEMDIFPQDLPEENITVSPPSHSSLCVNPSSATSYPRPLEIWHLCVCYLLAVERCGDEPVSQGPKDGMGPSVIPSSWS